MNVIQRIVILILVLALFTYLFKVLFYAGLGLVIFIAGVWLGWTGRRFLSARF